MLNKFHPQCKYAILNYEKYILQGIGVTTEFDFKSGLIEGVVGNREFINEIGMGIGTTNNRKIELMDLVFKVCEVSNLSQERLCMPGKHLKHSRARALLSFFVLIPPPSEAPLPEPAKGSIQQPISAETQAFLDATTQHRQAALDAAARKDAVAGRLAAIPTTMQTLSQCALITMVASMVAPALLSYVPQTVIASELFQFIQTSIESSFTTLLPATRFALNEYYRQISSIDLSKENALIELNQALQRLAVAEHILAKAPEQATSSYDEHYLIQQNKELINTEAARFQEKLQKALESKKGPLYNFLQQAEKQAEKIMETAKKHPNYKHDPDLLEHYQKMVREAEGLTDELQAAAKTYIDNQEPSPVFGHARNLMSRVLETLLSSLTLGVIGAAAEGTSRFVGAMTNQDASRQTRQTLRDAAIAKTQALATEDATRLNCLIKLMLGFRGASWVSNYNFLL